MREENKTLDESGGLVLTSDMWLAPRQPALEEAAAFDRRYAETLSGGLAGVSADQMAMALEHAVACGRLQGSEVITRPRFVHHV